MTALTVMVRVVGRMDVRDRRVLYVIEPAAHSVTAQRARPAEVVTLALAELSPLDVASPCMLPDERRGHAVYLPPCPLCRAKALRRSMLRWWERPARWMFVIRPYRCYQCGARCWLGPWRDRRRAAALVTAVAMELPEASLRIPRTRSRIR